MEIEIWKKKNGSLKVKTFERGNDIKKLLLLLVHRSIQNTDAHCSTTYANLEEGDVQKL